MRPSSTHRNSDGVIRGQHRPKQKVPKPYAVQWKINNGVWQKFKAYETQKQAEHALIQFRKQYASHRAVFSFKLVANNHEIPVPQ